MARISNKVAPVQTPPTNSTQSAMTPLRPLTPRASRGPKAAPDNFKSSAINMSNLQEQIRHLQASMEDLVPPPDASKSNSNSPSPSSVPSPDDTSISPPTISPVPSTPPETPLPCINELEDKPSHLYTIGGTDRDFLVYACNHCAPGEVLVSEGLLEDMQQKIENIAERGHKVVQDRLLALQELSIVKKHHAQLAHTMSNNAKKFKATEEDLRRQASKAEKAETLAEQVNADVLMHWNTALWEVATLKARVKELDGQMERETAARKRAEEDVAASKIQLDTAEKAAKLRVQATEQQSYLILTAKNQLQERLECETAANTAAEIEVASLKLHLTAAEDTTTALFQETSNAQNLLYVTKRHHEAQMKQEVDVRITVEREAETLLTRLQSAEGRARVSVDTNGRLEAKIQALTSDNGGIREVCTALQTARSKDATKIDALERRNAWLEERLSVYEETRWTQSTDTVSMSDSVSVPSRGQGQSWGFGSLRGLRRREADEEERISLDDVA